MRQRLEVILCNNSKVDRATLQRLVQIRMASPVGIDDRSTGKNDFKVLDIITCEAYTSGVEGVSTYQGIRHATTFV